MVTQLAKHSGYLSQQDREQFKEQLKAELGGESISEMTEIEQVAIKIEELHLLAMNHYNFKFPTNDPDIIIFNNENH